MATSTITNLKRVSFKQETDFNEIYDENDVFMELKVEDWKGSENPEILKTRYFDINRRLGETMSTGRVLGEFSYKTNIDEAWKTTKPLIESAIGKIVEYGDMAIISGFSGGSGGTPLTLQINVDWSAYIGEPVSFVDNNGNKSNINIVESATATEVTFRFKNTPEDLAILSSPALLATRSYIQLGATNPSDSFKVVEEFNDGSVKVFGGAGVTGSFKFNNTGKAFYDFKGQSATCKTLTDDESALLPALVNDPIPLESSKMLMYNFNIASVRIGTDAREYKCPVMFDLSINNTLKKESSMCNPNGVRGWYSEGDVTAKIKWAYNGANLLFFKRKDENKSGTELFLSQQDIAYYSPANFVGRKTTSDNGFDTVEFECSVNFDTTFIPMFVLPEKIEMI